MRLSGLQKVLWVLAGAAAFVFIWLLLWSDYRADLARTESEPPFLADFELTDHRGMVQTDEDFAGRWMLVFFGFTNCPDVCPTTLSEVAAVMEGLGDEAAMVQPIFITIDPERDTPTALAEYVPLFDAGIIGLTGTPEQIAATSETFPIFFERIEQATAPGRYTMGHTSHLFLFDTQAGFADSWPYGTPAEEILADLRQRI
ncbi:SCO1/SenC [Phaeobacter italicus]|uniref:SCO1/SenC n=1 Tax=Phaeobacter italicus TaxID=481446 RepID=A0A0H5CY65_9RHOB|nr:SCO1/SenC [Phaeobacter italicus]